MRRFPTIDVTKRLIEESGLFTFYVPTQPGIGRTLHAALWNSSPMPLASTWVQSLAGWLGTPPPSTPEEAGLLVRYMVATVIVSEPVLRRVLCQIHPDWPRYECMAQDWRAPSRREKYLRYHQEYFWDRVVRCVKLTSTTLYPAPDPEQVAELYTWHASDLSDKMMIKSMNQIRGAAELRQIRQIALPDHWQAPERGDRTSQFICCQCRRLKAPVADLAEKTRYGHRNVLFDLDTNE